MSGFTEEELAIAKSTDLVEVARSLGYTPVRVGHYYSLKEMDSLRIYDRAHWFRWSRRFERGSNGGSQIDFLRVFAGMQVKDAVFWLLDFAGYVRKEETPKRRQYSYSGDPQEHHCRDCRDESGGRTYSYGGGSGSSFDMSGLRNIVRPEEHAEERERREFVLPAPDRDNRRLFGYLCGDRGLSGDTVRWFVDNGLIYQSEKYKNVIFLGKDKDGTARFAAQRGTVGRNGKGFKCDVAGSDKHYGFNVVSAMPGDVQVHVFEAAIDLMSYADIAGHCNMNMVALGMLSDGPLETFMEEHPGLSTIVFHLDNDEPGRNATAALMEKYEAAGYETYDEPAPAPYKDINEYVQALAEPVRQAAR